LHRLYWSEHWPVRKIERHLNLGWRKIKKYLDAPAQGVTKRQLNTKLDPFKATVTEWLGKDPQAAAHRWANPGDSTGSRASRE